MPITPASSYTSFYIDMSEGSNDSGVDINRRAETDDGSVCIDMPTDIDESETHLSTNEQRAAWIATVAQQAVVSGLSWGFCNKLPALIGGAAGGLPGTIAGNFIGGILLGFAHYLLETACGKARTAIGHGCEYTPDTNAAKDKVFREGVFIGLFIGGNILKTLMKDAALHQDENHTLATVAARVAAEVGIDTGMSAMIGAAAQLITSSRKYIIGGTRDYKPISASEINWREAATRMAAGLGVGAASSSFAVMNRCISASPADGLQTAARISSSGVSLLSTLSVWFMLREAIANVMRSPSPPLPGSSDADIHRTDTDTSLSEVVVTRM